MCDYKSVAISCIDDHKEELRSLSDEIWRNPELNFQEYKAHKLLTDFLESKGFKVERGYCSLPTAFKAELGNKDNGVSVCVICEYDALPEIGHACGHNLIAEAGIAAGLGLQAALNAGLIGHVTVMGTPAEEGGGGKVELIERGAFNDIDIAMMVHPSPLTAIFNEYLAISQIQVTYIGKAAHAAAFPWEGINALDAVVQAYNGISLARQQFKPSWRVHAIITNGGTKPNIIPEKASAEYCIRAPNKQELEILRSKVISCFQAAADTTGCQVEIKKLFHDYDNVLTNPVLGNLFETHLRTLGVNDIIPSAPAGSTDMGNVSHIVPSIHPKYSIGSGEVNHSTGFTKVANYLDSHEKTLVAAKAMAMTCITVMETEGLILDVKKQFQKEKDFK